jgi:hypothetical protein
MPCSSLHRQPFQNRVWSAPLGFGRPQKAFDATFTQREKNGGLTMLAG